MRLNSVAHGNADFWHDFALPNFKGVGKYLDSDGRIVVITKSNKVAMPPAYEDSKPGRMMPHWTAVRYGFGQMFHGAFYDVEDVTESEGLTQSAVPASFDPRQAKRQEVEIKEILGEKTLCGLEEVQEDN